MTCRLCGLNSHDAAFCCAGCENVYAILEESGVLGSGQDFRDTELFRQSLKLGLISNRPEAAAPRANSRVRLTAPRPRPVAWMKCRRLIFMAPGCTRTGLPFNAFSAGFREALGGSARLFRTPHSAFCIRPGLASNGIHNSAFCLLHSPQGGFRVVSEWLRGAYRLPDRNRVAAEHGTELRVVAGPGSDSTPFPQSRDRPGTKQDENVLSEAAHSATHFSCFNSRFVGRES